ncbi:MAG: hypothetical protein AUJ97_08600 [Bacteroidetes bacterium CG2_30_32_10]|nr:MAG: hypothetical protein AUJ97_08600 [Bacteroidetes bacterium CG2_30_32_10]
MKLIRYLLFVFFVVLWCSEVVAQKTNINGYHFTLEKLLKTTTVKDQQQSSTCWSFATISFIETELIRMGKGEFDLSEMFIVHNTYPRKAEQFIRMQGYNFFTPGGQAHDVMTTIKSFGIMPENIFSGLLENKTYHDHTTLDKILKTIVDSTANKKRGEVSPRWLPSINKTLDSCLGEVPKYFKYQGENYTSLSFMNMLQFNPDDYIEITSYTHHPYNTLFVLEDKFNWASAAYYNVCLTDFMTIIDSVINKGFSIVWDGDVSEVEYFANIGIAVVPLKSMENKPSEKPEKEKIITETIRQAAFDDHSTTVDHLMHIVGKAKDQNGTTYYIVKNSWGNAVNDGFVYLSKSYIELKTIAIMINKHAIPKSIWKI